jgi:hypothetical protein
MPSMVHCCDEHKSINLFFLIGTIFEHFLVVTFDECEYVMVYMSNF